VTLFPYTTLFRSDVIFDDAKNRSVAVHSAGILEGLEQIYKADRISKELRNGKITP
jgi:hypothetical protein